MMDREKTLEEKVTAGLFETPERGLFYRKALGLRRFYENCPLPEYQSRPLYPSGTTPQPNYLDGLGVDLWLLSQDNKPLADRIKGDFCRYASTVPKAHTVAGDMWTHSMPNYPRILREGLASYIPRIEKIQDTDMRQGLLELVEGIEIYGKRCVEYLRSVSAESRLIRALERVPMYPAENIYEAVVAWNFVLYLDNTDNLGCVASGLYPYWRGEDIRDLLENLFDNLDANEGWSMALGTDYNPLTVQCLEAIRGKRRPMTELFVDETTPEEVWKTAFESIRSANGQPAFYNPHMLLDGLRKRFPRISQEDVKKFCGGGCTETMLEGLCNVGSLDAGIHLLLLLEQSIRQDLETAPDFEAFYRRFLDRVRETVDAVTREIANSQRERAKWNPLPMRTLLVDDCIDKGLDFNNGGSRYQWSIISFPGLINVIDAMLVIRDWIYSHRKIGAKELIARLEANDEGLLSQLKNHGVHHGDDNPDANSFALRISTDIFSMLDDKKPYFGEGFLPSSILFNSAVSAGRKIGATPDGRRAGAPLGDSVAAIFGKDRKGPTALLSSVTSLNLERALGVPVLNFNINPGFRDAILKALILGYMRSGGVQMQVTCISSQMLEEARRNPEDHRNLVVRVGGYSEYFCRLSPEQQQMIIDRTIQSEV